MMDWKEVANAAVLYALALVVMVVLSFVGKALTAWLNARKAAEDADASLSEESDKSIFLSLVEDMIDTAVNACGQVLVAGIKGTEAWTDQAKAQALEMVKDQVTLVLGEDGMAKLSGWLNDAEVWIVNKIEAAVLKNKGKWAGSVLFNEFKEPAEISDAAYEAATYEGTV